MTAGAGMFDEYNRPNTIIKNLSGIEQMDIVEPAESRVEFIKQDLPFTKPCTEINTLEGSTKPVAVFGAIARIRPSSSSKIISEFFDGSPAVVTRQYGKGKIIYCAFLPGLSYFKPAIPLKPVDRGSTDDAMSHFLPVDFEPSVGSLIRTAVTETPTTFVRDKDGNPIGVVETTVIESKNGIVIPLINWSTKPVQNAQIEINMDINKKNVSMASGNSINLIEVQKDRAIVGVDIDIADAIIIK